MKHKCRVFKTWNSWFPWTTQCQEQECIGSRGFLESPTWEEAMLEALHHRMRNGD
jgi:hypothetical protein